MIDLIILVVTSIANIVLAALVLVSNSKSKINRRFAYVIVTFLLWTLFNYLTDNVAGFSLIFARLTFLFAIGIAHSFVEFSNTFPTGREVMGGRLKLFTRAALALMALVSLSPLLVTSSEVVSGGGAELGVGSAYYVYFLAIIISLIIVVRNFILQAGRSTKNQKQQIRLLVVGLLLYVVFAVTSQLILPVIVDSWTSSRFGPVFTMLFIGFITLSIVRHKLFDIRSFVVRALVYLFSITTVGALYTVVIFTIGSLFIDIENISTPQRALLAGLALLIAMTYSPIIRFFNRITRRLFFRDAYDTQEVLDEVGKIIVGNIDLHKIQKSSLDVLSGALKTTYLGFILKSKTGANVQDFIGDKPDFNQEALEKSLHSVGKKELLYDELDQANSEKAQTLRKNDISLVIPLITKNDTVGYIVSGPKKSGNIFNQQDRGMLNIAAKELAVALQNAQRFEEIQAFNITLQQKVDEATKELKKTNKKLVELDEAKDEFISMASHQLRTPLTSIKGYLSMIMEGDLGKVSKQQDQALKEAFTSSQRMVFLISDFLNVSRIKTGKFVIEPKELNLSEMVKEELVQLREMAEAKQLTMVYEPPADFPTVKLDENKMHQVMMNMIDNAIYYTPNEGKITVQLYLDGKDVVFKVIDTGIGVPKSEQHKLFTKFFRAGNARKTRPDGTGLGLFMAQKVVVAQGGSIIFESEEGKGSTFGFRFALKDIKA